MPWSSASPAPSSVATRKDRRADVVACPENGPITAREIAEPIGFTRQSALDWLDRLESEGRVRTTAVHRRSREHRWALTDEVDSDER